VILLGRDYWQGLIDWARDVLVPSGKINPADLELIRVTDDVDEAVAAIVASARERSDQAKAEAKSEASAPTSYDAQ